MTAPPPTTAPSTPATGRTNRESRKIAAHRLKAAERVTGRRLSDATFAHGVRALLRGHLADDESLCKWLMEQAPVPRARAVARRPSITAADLRPT